MENKTVVDETLTERQQREKEYYEQFANSFDITNEIDFTPVDGPLSGKERRPWNSYWATYELSIDLFKKGARLLDFGSGPGENALRLSKIGYQIDGFDISEKNIEVSKQLFEKYKMSDKATFQVSSAESLPYEDKSFEVIVGVDILHHIDIDKSVRECHRVLKDDGVAIFREPLEVPILDFIRNLKIVKIFAPTEKSFELHITEDERKLNQVDVEILRNIFPNMEMRKYLFLSRFDKFFRKGSDPQPSVLEKIDHFLITFIPGIKYLGGVVIFILKK
jgi:ubiquinone/menaquinone biosynthesis C-methylase UbiE